MHCTGDHVHRAMENKVPLHLLGALTEPQDSVPHMTSPRPQGNRGPETPAIWILVNIPTHASLNILVKSFSYIFNFYFYVEGVLPACISVRHTHT